MSFCQTRKRSTQSSKVERRVAGMSEISFGQNAGHFIKYLTSLKLGLTLFHEGANAFEAIVRMETFELGLDFALERFHKNVFFACEDGLFHSANGELRAFGDFFGESGDAGFEFVRWEEVVDDAEPMRGLSVDHFAEVEHFGCDGWADELGEKVGAAVIGEQADLGKILAEDGAIHGEANVAGEGEIHAGAGGGSVDGGDDRLRHSADIQDSLHAGAEDGAEFGGIAALAAFADGAQIASSTKRAASTSEHDNVGGRIIGDAEEGFVESCAEFIV